MEPYLDSQSAVDSATVDTDLSAAIDTDMDGPPIDGNAAVDEIDGYEHTKGLGDADREVCSVIFLVVFLWKWYWKTDDTNVYFISLGKLVFLCRVYAYCFGCST